jgi:hypothetical protein
MHDLTEQQIAKLIASLRPAPEAWVQAAQELPRAREAIDTLAARAQADARQRQAIVQDLEAALQAQGVEPRGDLIQELRGRLNETTE